MCLDSTTVREQLADPRNSTLAGDTFPPATNPHRRKRNSSSTPSGDEHRRAHASRHGSNVVRHAEQDPPTVRIEDHPSEQALSGSHVVLPRPASAPRNEVYIDGAKPNRLFEFPVHAPSSRWRPLSPTMSNTSLGGKKAASEPRSRLAPLSWLIHDAPEYEERKKRVRFDPPNVSIKDVHAAVPRHLFEKSTAKSVFYVGRHVALSYLFYAFAVRIDRVASAVVALFGWAPRSTAVISWFFWALYWFWQSVAFAGMWTLGHECGHDALSQYPLVNIVLGLGLHTWVLTPYFAWRITHRSHHKGANNLARDETYHPFTRTDLNLPDAARATPMDYKEIIEETPLYTLFKMVIRQFLGFQLYLIHNRKGNPKYPPWTSHYKPSSKLFKPQDRNYIIASDIAIGCMLLFLAVWSYRTSFNNVWNLYFVPWLWAHNWIVMFTYLQHSDPTVPYYREKAWTFARGALATVDRPVFGWIGRFFWHGIAHDHVAHHFFVNIPFYNLPQVTEAIKPVLGEYYCYDSTPTLYALWRSFTQCTFIEPEGDVVFFKNQWGEALREYAGSDVKGHPAEEGEDESDALKIAGL